MKNFLLSFLIVLAAFAAGAYLSPRLGNGGLINVSDARQPFASDAPRTLQDDLAARPAVDESLYTPEELHTIALFEGASPSVCYITTKTRQRSFWSMNITEVPSGSGSGFIAP